MLHLSLKFRLYEMSRNETPSWLRAQNCDKPTEGYPELREPIKTRENCYPLIWWILMLDGVKHSWKMLDGFGWGFSDVFGCYWMVLNAAGYCLMVLDGGQQCWRYWMFVDFAGRVWKQLEAVLACKIFDTMISRILTYIVTVKFGLCMPNQTLTPGTAHKSRRHTFNFVNDTWR